VNGPAFNPPASPPNRRWPPGSWVVASICLGLLGAVAYTALRPPPISVPVLPNPNGYDQLVRAGEQLVGEPGDATNAALLRAFINRNNPALTLARQGLRLPACVPVGYTNGWIGAHLPELAALKRVARAIQCQARLAEAEHRFNDAAEDCLDCVRFGQQASRGGVLIDRLVGFAVETIGLRELAKAAARLNPTKRAEVLRALARLEMAQDPVAAAFAAERAWQKRTATLAQRLAAWLSSGQMRRVEQSFAARDRRVRTLFRQVRRELQAPTTPTNQPAASLASP
jgi:hypothetical protein